MPVVQGADRRSLHVADDGGGTKLQGDSAGSGALYRFQEVLGKEVDGGTPPNAARRGKREVGTVGQ